MKPLSRKISGFTRTELLACLIVAGTLVWLGRVGLAAIRGPGTPTVGVLGNARALHLATQAMTLDTKAAKEGMEWTMLASHGETTPVSLATYFEALVDNHYLTGKELAKLLTMPGKRPSKDHLTAENIGFKFFQVDDDSPADQPLLVTANWGPSGLTDHAPYGKKGFVVFNKLGSGGIFVRLADTRSPDIFPAGSKDGHPYRYITLE